MSESVALADIATRDDLRIFLERLHCAGREEVRLVSHGAVLAVYGCVQAPETLLDRVHTVVVMRGVQLAEAPAHPIDVTTQGQALRDRIARMEREGESLMLPMPDTRLNAAWAGVLPPMSDWQPQGVVSTHSLESVARDGIARVAAQLPDQPGEAIVRSVRERVWGLDIAPGVPAIMAFAAEVMGFLRDEQTAKLARSHTWLRLTTGRGHVLVRGLMR